MKIRSFFKKKTISFILQFILLTFIIYVFSYSFQIEFDPSTEIEQRVIIEFLAKYVLFLGVNGTLFMYSTWLLVSLIPILTNLNYKKAYSTNLLTFFVLNFFVYVFLFVPRQNQDIKVTRDFFNSNFMPLLWNSIILGLAIITFSIFLSLLLQRIKSTRLGKNVADQILSNEPLIICPKCGTEYDSIPLYCYNCNFKLTSDEIDSIE
jgi:hypothetical protein